MLRCAADNAKSGKVAQVYNETADALDAMNASYNQLHAMAEQACEEGDLSTLRAYFRKHNERARILKEKAQEASGTE